MLERTTTRKLAVIVSADVAGYSRLMSVDEDGTLRDLKAHRSALTDPKIAEFQGRIVKTAGDGMLLEFPSVVDAVRCCLEIQKGMLARNEAVPPDRRIQFRIGVNLGDVIVDGDDIFGKGVNVAARLEGMADPGGICISQAVLDQVRQGLELQVEDLGEQALKNIEEPVRTYRLLDVGPRQRARRGGPGPHRPEEALPALPRRPSVAIMPFRNLSADGQSDYIANGIGLGIQTLLVQLSGLFLVNASAHQGYREGKVTAAEAVKEFPVRYVLEGAVQQAGQRVRVMVQLTDLTTDTVTWADRYDCGLEDVFALQDDVTREVIASLGREILGQNLDRIWTRRLSKAGAWEYFLRGISHFYKFTRHDNAAAREMFERIHELHPDKVIGPAYIAVTHWFDATRGWADAPADSIEQARRWAERSLEPEEEHNGLSHVILGSIRVREGRHEEGLALCRKGTAFRANCPLTLGQLAEAQLYAGDPHAAVKNAREALALRMIYPPPLVNVLAAAYRDAGEIELSIPAAREAARLDPRHADALVTLCTDYVLAGLGADAQQVARQILELDPEFRSAAYAAKLPYRDAGRREAVAEALRSAGLPA
ncbi:MAG TPA: adenylate/guanylate cyclase domain-containing protein [Thermohalobaculum sp.]|nr:adenylate/guanylate cyclase domain-containing protein [Thermohalobaculum sp.]